jgi:hypothetical protein
LWWAGTWWNFPPFRDQELLARVATSDKAPGVRLVAALKLEDQALAQRVYGDLAGTEGWGRWHWGEIAVRKLDDQALLARIAVSDPSQSIREAAIWRLEDQALLERIARNDPAWSVRRAAEDRLKDLRNRR